MTPRADLEALIARLEAAKEGSRELDAEIAVAIFETISIGDDLIYAMKTVKSDGCAAGTYWRKSRSGMSLQTAPNFTRSVDAALTLVPEKWRVAWLAEDWGPQIDGTAEHGPPGEWICYLAPRGRWQNERQKVAPPWCKTVPLALCIAALRARLAEMKEDDRG